MLLKSQGIIDGNFLKYRLDSFRVEKRRRLTTHQVVRVPIATQCKSIKSSNAPFFFADGILSVRTKITVWLNDEYIEKIQGRVISVTCTGKQHHARVWYPYRQKIKIIRIQKWPRSVVSCVCDFHHLHSPLHIPDPLSTTRAAISSSSDILLYCFVYYLERFWKTENCILWYIKITVVLMFVVQNTVKCRVKCMVTTWAISHNDMYKVK
jgi:hypothetical protein